MANYYDLFPLRAAAHLPIGQPDAGRIEYDSVSFKFANIHVTLGSIENNAHYLSLSPPPIQLYERHPYLLFGAIGLLAVGIIGGLAFRLFKQTRVW